MFRPALAFAAILVAASVTARADDLADAISAIPGAVEEVRLVGTWKIDEAQGAYRVITARAGADFSTSRLFVQWLEMTAEGTIKLRQQKEITEVAELGTSIVDYSSEVDEHGLALFIDTAKSENDVPQTYELFMFGLDDYDFGPASN